MTIKTLLSAGTAAGALICASAASAQDFTPKHAGMLKLDVRVSDVAPSTNDAIVTASGGPTGLRVDVSDSVMPTLGFTYFVTDQLAVEAILGTTPHEIRAKGSSTNVEVHDTWVLPPVITLQYHPLPRARFSPYVGAGVNAMFFYGGDDKNGFSVKLKNGVGGAVQVGADYALKGPWSLNLDVKKVWFETDANINSGALKSKVNLDPVVASLGFSRKF